MDDNGVVEIANDVYWVGIKDWNNRLFDSLMPLPAGTSYNAYLIKGHEGSVLIDTVRSEFASVLERKLTCCTELSELKYIVMNHAEPDHAGALSMLLNKTDARVLATKKGVELASSYYNLPVDRFTSVDSGTSFEFGGVKLSFIEAPWLHWPETMFTYLHGQDILFSCDFFGAHLAKGIYAEELNDAPLYARRYFAEIMMPFREMGRQAMRRIMSLEIKLIAPSHGPVYRNPKSIMDAYNRWLAGETKQKVVVLTTTMWGSSYMLAECFVDTLLASGVEVASYDVARTDLGEIAQELVDTRAIVVVAPTVLGTIHPIMEHMLNILKLLRPPAKYGALLSSKGWSGGAVQRGTAMLKAMGLEVVGIVDCVGVPTYKDLEATKTIARQLAEKIQQ